MKFPNQVLEPKSTNHILRYCNFLTATPAKSRFKKNVAARKLQYLGMRLMDFGSKT